MRRAVVTMAAGAILMWGCASGSAVKPSVTPAPDPGFVTVPELQQQIASARDSIAKEAAARAARHVHEAEAKQAALDSGASTTSTNAGLVPATTLKTDLAHRADSLRADSVARVRADVQRRAQLALAVQQARADSIRIVQEAIRVADQRAKAMRDSAAHADSVKKKARDVYGSLDDEPWIRLRGEPAKISLDVYNKDLSDVAALFSEKGGVTILLSNESEVQSAKITADIKDQPWNLALENLLKASKLRAVQDTATNTIIIQSEARSASRRPAKIIQLRYMYADEIIGTLQQYLQASNGGQGAGSTSGSGDIINIVGGSGGGGTSGGGSIASPGGAAGAASSSAARSRKLAAFVSPDKLAGIMDLIRQLDRKPATVSIMAQMITVNRSELENLGLSYKFVPTGSSSTSDVGAVVTQTGTGSSGSSNAASALFKIGLNKVNDINVFIDALKSDGLAQVQSSPVVTTLSDHTANIQAGEFFIFPNQSNILTAGGSAVIVPGQNGQQQGGQQGSGQYSAGVGGLQQGGGQFGAGISQGGNQFGQVSTGTVFSVTPYALAGNKVRVNIQISKNGGGLSATGGSLSGTGQSAASEVLVSSGQRIVIAGLRVSSQTTSNTKVPVLGDLPMVGGLFRNHQKATLNQELVIIIQPVIIDPADDNPDDLVP